LLHTIAGAIDTVASVCYILPVSTLKEIETAAKKLPPVEQQELLVFVANSLRSQGRPLPPPRRFSADEIKSWMDEDERDLREFKDGA
jgi:hypothetical protein